jgi:hypothetical protein
MGINRWRQIGQRLAQMDRAELRDRARQEFTKRQDVVLAGVGYDFARDSRHPVSGNAGNFFFTPGSVDSVLALLRQRLLGHAERVVRQADQICKHRFDLLGYHGLDYGSPIAWHLDAVHRKLAQRKAFYRIRYLDFAEVGDSKVTWELNRHQHLVTLAKAYRFTGDLRYADEALRQWRHWRAENPYLVGINWASSLEVAFRSLSWIWTYHLLQGSRGVPDIREEWLRGLALHGRYIERYLSTYFSPNTHLLGEGVALFFLGVLCPELAAAERWKVRGWEIVLQEAARQVRGDGFHFEQSTYYHVYALDFFLHSAVLASLNGVPTPKSFEDTLEKMLTALCLLGRGGPPPRFGDDDGGRLFDPARNRGEHLLDPLATGAILFRRGDYKAAAGSLREETLWLLGAEGVRQWDELQEATVSAESTALPDAGLYMLCAEKTQLVVAVGAPGTQSGGHGHADALSICLQSHGHALLIDPGTFEYIGPGDDRDRFRGTAMHNTLRVDRANQAETAAPFSWRGLTKSNVEKWIGGKNFDLLVASHDGYARLEPPATHRRWVVSLKNGIYLVRDVVTGEGKHRLDLDWHLGPDLQLVEDGAYRVKGASQGLALLPVQGHGWAEAVRRGFWSPAYGQKAPMTTLNFGTDAVLPAEVVFLLVTLEEAHRGVTSFIRTDGAAVDSDAVGYRYRGEGLEYSFVFGARGKPWQMGPLSSNAEFACWKRGPRDTDQHLILCGGSYARPDGGAELRCARAVEWAELVLNAGDRAVFSSDIAAIEEPPTDLRQKDPPSESSE